MFPKKRNINLIIDFIYIEMIDFFKIGIREIFKKEYYDIAKALAKRRMILTVEVTNPINKCSIKGILNEEGLQCSAIMNCSSIIDLLEGSKCNIYITFKKSLTINGRILSFLGESIMLISLQNYR